MRQGVTDDLQGLAKWWEENVYSKLPRVDEIRSQLRERIANAEKINFISNHLQNRTCAVCVVDSRAASQFLIEWAQGMFGLPPLEEPKPTVLKGQTAKLAIHYVEERKKTVINEMCEKLVNELPAILDVERDQIQKSLHEKSPFWHDNVKTRMIYLGGFYPKGQFQDRDTLKVDMSDLKIEIFRRSKGASSCFSGEIQVCTSEGHRAVCLIDPNKAEAVFKKFEAKQQAEG